VPKAPSLGLFDAHGVSYWRRYRAGLKSKARDIGRVRWRTGRTEGSGAPPSLCPEVAHEAVLQTKVSRRSEQFHCGTHCRILAGPINLRSSGAPQSEHALSREGATILGISNRSVGCVGPFGIHTPAVAAVAQMGRS